MLCTGTIGGPPGGKGGAAGGTRTSRSVRKSGAPVAERDLCPAMRRRWRTHMKGFSEFFVCPGAVQTRGPFSIVQTACCEKGPKATVGDSGPDRRLRAPAPRPANHPESHRVAVGVTTRTTTVGAAPACNTVDALVVHKGTNVALKASTVEHATTRTKAKLHASTQTTTSI